MSDKEAGQVLTSENSAEFYANRLGLADQPEVEAVQAEPTEVVEERSEPEIEIEQEEKPKANPKLERRFSEITKQREEARKEAQQERQAREALEARLAVLERQPAPQAPKVDEEPQPSQFNDAFEYAKALAEYTADKRIAEMKQEEAKAKEAAERQKVIDQWTQKVQKAKADLGIYFRTQGRKVRPVDVARIRAITDLSQQAFAKACGISVHTLRNWEQGRRAPRGPARALLLAIARDPVAVIKALRG